MMKTFFYSLIFSIFTILSCSHGLWAKITITTKGDATIKRSDNEINILQRVTITHEDLKYESDTLKIQYYSINNLANNLKQQNSSNFKRIEGNGNIIISVHDGILKGDNYLYNVDKKVMVLRSTNKRTSYESENLLISVNDRFEFQEESNLVILRGLPIITFKNDANINNNTKAKSNLIYAKLSDDRKDIKFIQAFDNIEILTPDGAKINSNYGYYLPETGLITLEEKVKMTRDGSVINACKIIFDTISGISDIIPCGENISGTFINE